MSIEEPLATPLLSQATPAHMNFLVRHGYMLALAGLTIAGGFVRFFRLGDPPLLGDEARTFMRVSGTYAQMLPTLQTDGFPPLFYELYWWISQGLPIGFGLRLIPGGVFMTPFMMRLVPALTGTFMIPVMYFLARQLFAKRTALLVAAFTACSAYLVGYSQNAKMYMLTWLLIALNLGCFLHWVRRGGRIGWLCWVASGAAMGGVHVTSLILLIIQPFILVTARGINWKRGVFFILGLIVIGAGPAGYYLGFNHWVKQSGGLAPGAFGEVPKDAKWKQNDLGWIASAQSGRDGKDLFFYSTNEFLYGYEWPPPRTWRGALTATYPVIPRGIIVAAVATISTLLFLFAVGAMPWRVGQPIEPIGRPEQSWWRTALWLALWMVIPTYGIFYCRSIRGFVSPGAWFVAAGETLGLVGWLIAVVIAVALVLGMLRWRPTAWVVLGALALALAVTATISIVRGQVLWFDQWINLVNQRWILVPAIGAGLALLFTYAGPTMRDRWRQISFFAIVLGIVIALCWVAYGVWNWAYLRTKAARPDLDWQSIWWSRYIAIVWPALALAACALIMRLPTRPLRILGVIALLLPNVVNVVARIHPGADAEVPYDKMIADAWSARDRAGTRRTFIDISPLSSSDQSTSERMPGAVYYACQMMRIEPSPEEFNTGRTLREFKRQANFLAGSRGRDIRMHIDRATQVTEVIVWDRPQRRGRGVPSYQRPDPTPPDQDEVLRSLGTGWKLAEENFLRHRSHWFWSWMEKEWYRQRRYVRAAPGTAPSR